MKERPGFTLLEVIVALAIMAVVFSAVYSVFAFQNRAAEAASEGRELFSQAHVILDRLGRDLSCAWLPQAPNPGERIVYSFVASTERLDFTSSAALSLEAAPGPDLVEIGYEIAPGDSGEDRLVLLRRQDDTPDESPLEGGSTIALTRDLKSLEITFVGANGQEETVWQAQSAGELPRAARIVLTLATEAGRQETFMDTVLVTLAEPPVKSLGLPLSLGAFK